MLIQRVGNWPFTNQLSGFSEIDRLRNDLAQLLTSRRGRLGGEISAGVFPLLNVNEDQDNFYIRSEIPGMTLEEFDVTVTGRNVTIAGERKIPAEDEKVRYHRREREAGKFRRQFNLPSDIDNNRVQAKYRHGMLMIVLPKAESSKPRKIAIDA